MDEDNTLNVLNGAVRYVALTAVMTTMACGWVLAHMPSFWLVAAILGAFGSGGIVLASLLHRVVQRERVQQRLHRIVVG